MYCTGQFYEQHYEIDGVCSSLIFSYLVSSLFLSVCLCVCVAIKQPSELYFRQLCLHGRKEREKRERKERFYSFKQLFPSPSLSFLFQKKQNIIGANYAQLLGTYQMHALFLTLTQNPSPALLSSEQPTTP